MVQSYHHRRRHRIFIFLVSSFLLSHMSVWLRKSWWFDLHCSRRLVLKCLHHCFLARNHTILWSWNRDPLMYCRSCQRPIGDIPRNREELCFAIGRFQNICGDLLLLYHSLRHCRLTEEMKNLFHKRFHRKEIQLHL